MPTIVGQRLLVFMCVTRLAQRQFGRCAKTRKRRAQLVSGIGGEAPHASERIVQSLEHLVPSLREFL